MVGNTGVLSWEWGSPYLMEGQQSNARLPQAEFQDLAVQQVAEIYNSRLVQPWLLQKPGTWLQQRGREPVHISCVPQAGSSTARRAIQHQGLRQKIVAFIRLDWSRKQFLEVSMLFISKSAHKTLGTLRISLCNPLHQRPPEKKFEVH